MDKRLHTAGAGSGKARNPPGTRAGLPIKRFFTRFGSLADLPAEDLDLLSGRITGDLDVNQGADMAALQAAVRAELRHRIGAE